MIRPHHTGEELTQLTDHNRYLAVPRVATSRFRQATGRTIHLEKRKASFAGRGTNATPHEWPVVLKEPCDEAEHSPIKLKPYSMGCADGFNQRVQEQ